jgi:hypothetical protein
VIAQFWLRLAAAAGMPLSLLVGQVKGGLGDAGNTDLRFFYDRVAAMQRRILVPVLKKLVRYLMLSKEGPTKGVVPERWEIKCRPLYRLDALQEATRRKTVAETDHIYMQDGVLTTPEVATGAFGKAEFSAERTIDIEGRRKVAMQEKAARAERMKQAQARLTEQGTQDPKQAAGAAGGPAASGSTPSNVGEKPEVVPPPKG